MEVFITIRFAAFHRYPDAPEEVAFLRNGHRHLFHVKVWFEEMKEREHEFFIEKERVKQWIEQKIDRNDAGSCEKIAQVIAQMDSDITRVEVSEDGENGVIFNRCDT